MTAKRRRSKAKRQSDGDPPPRAALGAIGLMVALMVVSLAVVAGLFGAFGKRLSSGTTVADHVSPPRDRPAHPAPQESQDRYEWIDQKAGRVHIPIGRAMEIVAQHGWPDDSDAGAQR